MKNGDILVCKFGYNCTLVEFFKIIKMTEKTVTVVEIESKIVEDDDYGQAGKVIPTDNVIGSPIRRKIGEYQNIKLDSYKYAYIWDGKPVDFDTYD